MGWWCHYISGGTNVIRLDLVLALSNVIASDHRASMLESMSVTSGISGAVFYKA